MEGTRGGEEGTRGGGGGYKGRERRVQGEGEEGTSGGGGGGRTSIAQTLWTI